MAANHFPDDLKVQGASEPFLRALVQEWGKYGDTLPLNPDIIAEACESLAIRRFVFPELYLLFHEQMPTHRRIDLSDEQWSMLASTLDHSYPIVFNRLAVSLYQSTGSIPDAMWHYFVATITENNEALLLSLPSYCTESLLNSAIGRLSDSENGRAATLLLWAFRLLTGRCSAADVPDDVLEIGSQE
ncbi:MAG: hypothetical protein JW384_02980 [Nitrosomonadaceae bacterium]|nr:hypothetical protein [Nitrosomonadaceae bacterium]